MLKLFRKKAGQTDKNLSERAQILADESEMLARINKEFKLGFEFIRKHPQSVTFFGSARFAQDTLHCMQAYGLARRVAEELGYTVVTGGGGGIMEAANHGAKDGGGKSIGVNIKLPHEQHLNPYVDDRLVLSYFFVRKTILTFSAEAFIFSPGGFGTLDEFFDILTLIQTGKAPHVPIILLGSDFWKPLQHFIHEHMLKTHGSIDANDAKLYVISDDFDKIITAIKGTAVHGWWKNFEQN